MSKSTGAAAGKTLSKVPLPSPSEGLLHIAAVSYEGSLFGWETNLSPSESHGDDAKSMNLKFGFHCSIGSLKAVAVSNSGKFLACAGTDERIRIFDLNANKSLGELSQHSGAITCLEFFGDSYLLSGSDDHSVCIWRVHDWICVHILGGHKDIVTDLSIHPSGKIALSVSKDGSMKMWNLIEGRCAFTKRLKSSKAATQIGWNSNGESYFIVYDNEVQVYLSADNSCIATLIHRSRVNRTCFLPSISGMGSNLILTLCEDRSMSLHTDLGAVISTVIFPEEGKRTRSMSIRRVKLSSKDRPSILTATVITSTGTVFVTDLTSMLPRDSTASATVATSVINFEDVYMTSYSFNVEPRLTCVTSWTKRGKVEKEKDEEAIVVHDKKQKGDGESNAEAAETSKRAVRFDDIDDNATSRKKQKKLAKSERRYEKLRGGFVMKTEYEETESFVKHASDDGGMDMTRSSRDKTVEAEVDKSSKMDEKKIKKNKNAKRRAK
jgi:protein MAK11